MKDTLVGLGKILQKASEASWVVTAPDYECTYTCEVCTTSAPDYENICNMVACGADEYADSENGAITACSPAGEVGRVGSGWRRRADADRAGGAEGKDKTKTQI